MNESAPLEPGAVSSGRSVILHYHYFKNAGTSLDAVLKQNFAGKWVNREFEGRDTSAMVAAWISREGGAIAFSSHTAQFPVPVIAGITIFPVVFVRHPLDRIASAYRFERRQGGDGFGPKLARETDLSGYIEGRLANPHDRQCRDFHVSRMAMQQRGVRAADLEAAMTTLLQLPFIGVVEEFDLSLAVLERKLKPLFPSFHVTSQRLNASAESGSTLEQRLQEMKSELGEERYQRLVAENLRDISLHQAALIRLRELD